MLVCLHQVTPWRRHSCLPCRDSSRYVLRCLRAPPGKAWFPILLSLYLLLRVFLRASASPRQIERLVPSTAVHSRNRMLVCLHQVTPWRRHSCLPCRDSSRYVLRCLRAPPGKAWFPILLSLYLLLRVFLRASASPRQIEVLAPSTAVHSRKCSLRLSQRLCVSAGNSHSRVPPMPAHAAFSASSSPSSPQPPPPPPCPTSPCSPKTLAPGPAPTSSPPSPPGASPPACRGFSWRALAPPPASNGPPAWSAAPF